MRAVNRQPMFTARGTRRAFSFSVDVPCSSERVLHCNTNSWTTTTKQPNNQKRHKHAKMLERHWNIRKYMKTDHFHELAFIFYVLTCILNVRSKFPTVVCVLGVFGPIQKDARRKTMSFDGTRTFRSFTSTRLVTKTMDGLNPPNVNPINSN